MQVRKYLLFGSFFNIELICFSIRKVLGDGYLNLNLILTLRYGGMDDDPCGPTIGLSGEFNSSNTHMWSC